MALFALNQIWQLRVACYITGQAAINTFHYKVGALNGAPKDVDVIDVFDNALAPLYKTLLNANAHYRGVSLSRVFPAPRTKPVVRVVNDGPGVVAGDLLPSQVCGIISATTDFAGPKYRGRAYIPFPGEVDNLVGAVPTATYVASAQLLANKVFGQWLGIGLVAGVNDVTLDPVIFHRTGATSDLITGSKSKAAWATQRKRGAYGRLNPIPF